MKLTLQLVENAQREDVHPLEEAFAYRALLDMPEPKYDVASIAVKVGKSIGHVYGRLRYVDLIEPAAQAFLENRLTAGHALLIARLPQSQQPRALDAAFRSHWGSTEKQVVPVRELAQWIRQNLMLQLEDAIFDREDEALIAEAGSCLQCQKRTGFNTALFADFQNDDRCLDSACYEAKVAAWLRRQTEQNPSLVQISEYYGTPRDQPTIPRSEYVEIKPAENKEEPERPNQVVCESAATGIVVEGNHVGRTVQICADPECRIHHAPAQQKREERDEEYERALEERQRNLA
jgi:ParB family chromosome partitioning protein